MTVIKKFDSLFGRIKDERARCALISFVASIFFFIYFVVRHELSFPFDSGYYWNEADAVFADGFNLLAFPETFRGYFLPIFYGGIKKAGSLFGNMGPYYLFWGVRSVIYGVFFSVIMPGLFRIKRITGRVFIGVLSSLLMIFYFIDDLPFPLTDTASFVAFSTSVYFGLRAWNSSDWNSGSDQSGDRSWNDDSKNYSDQKRSSNSKKLTGVIGFGFLSGLMMYLSYNIRILNLYGFILLLVYYVAAFILVAVKLHGKDIHVFAVHQCSFLLAFLFGALVAAAPQMAINHHYRGTFTPRVLYEQLQNYEGTQELMELESGIERYKYDTYVGTSLEYPYSGIAYQDAAGEYLLERVPGEFSVGKLISMFIHYPVDMIGVYGRNVFSLMTITTGDYITHFHENQNLRFILVVLMWIMTAIVVFVSWPKLFETLVTHFYIVAMLIPAVLEISDAPEIRFFYPVYFCIFAVLCYAGNLTKTIQFIKEHFFYVLLGSVFVLVLWSGVYGNVLMENGAGIPRLIGDARVEYQEDVIYQGDVTLSKSESGQGAVAIAKVDAYDSATAVEGALTIKDEGDINNRNVTQDSKDNNVTEDTNVNKVYQVSYRTVSSKAEFYIVASNQDMTDVRGVTTYFNPETKRYEGAIALSQKDLPLEFMLIYNASEDVVISDLKIASITSGDL